MKQKQEQEQGRRELNETTTKILVGLIREATNELDQELSIRGQDGRDIMVRRHDFDRMNEKQRAAVRGLCGGEDPFAGPWETWEIGNQIGRGPLYKTVTVLLYNPETGAIAPTRHMNQKNTFNGVERRHEILSYPERKMMEKLLEVIEKWTEDNLSKDDRQDSEPPAPEYEPEP